MITWTRTFSMAALALAAWMHHPAAAGVPDLRATGQAAANPEQLMTMETGGRHHPQVRHAQASGVVAQAPAGHGPVHEQGEQGHGAAHSAEVYRVGALVIEGPWLRATPKGARVAGGYMRIVNTGKEADRLVGGSLDQVGRVEIHEMSMENDIMRMRPLPNGLEIKPGETVELKPGGFHIMGIGLSGSFTEGETVKGTLTFEHAGSLSVEYRVGPIAGGAGHGAHH